jgi:hypothetical protein
MRTVIFSLLMSLSLASFAQDKPACKGTTKKGQPCKSVIVSKKTGYCNSHNPNAVKCSSLTSSKKPCGMTVKAAGLKCRFHNN